MRNRNFLLGVLAFPTLATTRDPALQLALAVVVVGTRYMKTPRNYGVFRYRVRRRWTPCRNPRRRMVPRIRGNSRWLGRARG